MTTTPRKLSLALVALASLVVGSCGGEADRGAEPLAPAEPAPAAVGTAAASPLDRLPDSPAGEIVRRAIDAAGGWQAWAAQPTVSYLKVTDRYGPDGEIESSRGDRHRYRLDPSPAMRIEYTGADGREITLINSGQEAWKLVDGALATDEADRNQAWNSTFGSQYVFSMPFKLTDPGAILSYEGRVTLADGTEVDAVRAEYEPGAGSAGGMHVWTYYFDPDDAHLVANLLEFGPDPDDWEYTEYFDHRAFGDLTLPSRRISYHSNAAGEKLVKASQLTNREVRFGVPLAEDLFRPPS